MARRRKPQSWTDILESLYEGSWNRDLHRFRSPYAFRGLPRAPLPLTSSLVRLAGNADTPRVEMALLRNFRKYAHCEGEQARTIWDWLALGQHRGLPTRLMDWTYSPLVALHFVTDSPEDMDEDGVVWCVNFVEANKRLPARLRRIMHREGSETLTTDMLTPFASLGAFDAMSKTPFLVFLEPPAVDKRILNQHALFSLMSSPKADMGEWLRQHPDLVRRVEVPAGLKWEIRDKLDQANINERILFPDLDGLSRWLARYYQPAIFEPRARRAPAERRARARVGESEGQGPSENDETHAHPDFNARDRDRRTRWARRAAPRRASRSRPASR